ncbi:MULTISPECIES: anthranilate synthase component I family protein [Sphingobacterium]|uniref:anthranilate synthase component I family protein n=1 Tax=Sphingobacterium TaxID=28453 RepID=UPI0013DA2F9D|nr:MULTISPECIES: anthranilate synthase component I family protein [unclassified Sphingobacterium]
MAKAIFEVDHLFEAKALEWAQQFEQVCYFQSNGYKDAYSSVASLLAVDAKADFESDGTQTFAKVENFKTKYPQNWMLGFFSYDLKNELEALTTSQPDNLGFPEAYFFIPKTVLKFSNSSLEIESNNPEEIFQSIDNFSFMNQDFTRKRSAIRVKKRMSKEVYFNAFEKMMYHIKRGDIYEVNLCQEFYAEQAILNPIATYNKLNRISPTPFSTFFKLRDKFVLSASPERFLAKRGHTLISQPIKGTAPRGVTEEEDECLKSELRNNPKEIAENVMIVDLVRNDMTQSVEPASVDASRKLEVHTFKQVHQLISTITGQQKADISDIQALKNLFPPGSMTGAPKISAMRLCDLYEKSKRGIYAGTVGYFSPDGDFDFNVVIRTILYNQSQQYLSFHTGGALTYSAKAEEEYKECLLKASAIIRALDSELK